MPLSDSSSGRPTNGTARHMAEQNDQLAVDAQQPNGRRFRRPSATLVILTLFVLALVAWAAFFSSLGDSRLYLAFGCGVAVLFAVAVFTLYALKCKGRDLEIPFFLGAMIVLGLISLFVMPPRTIPDEVYHYQSSYNLSNILLGQESISGGRMTVRACDERLVYPSGRVYVTRDAYQEVFDLLNGAYDANDTSGTTTVIAVSSFPATTNPPQVKIVSAIGLVIGRLLGLGAVPLYYLGRLFNLVAFIAVVYFAVRLIPFGKRLLMMLCLLPSTISLAASYSYDGPIIAMAFLLTALELRAIYGKGLLPIKEIVAIFVTAVLLAPCKVVYVVIAGLFLFVPTKRFASRRDALLWKGGFLVVVLAGFLGLRFSDVLNRLQTSTEQTVTTRGGEGGEEGVKYSISLFWTDPAAALHLMGNTLYTQLDDWLTSLVGGDPGWYQSQIKEPLFMVLPSYALLILANMPDKPEPQLKPGLRTFMIVAWIAAAFGIVVSMMLDFTFVTQDYVFGVQGRYFLPLLPLMFLSVRSNAIQIKRPSWLLLISAAVLVALLSYVRIFGIGITLVLENVG